MNNFNNNELTTYKNLNLSTFISRKEARQIMSKINSKYKSNHQELENKLLFLNKFSKLGLVKRNYYSTNESLPQLEQKLYIIKPIHGSWGRNIRTWAPPFEVPNDYIIEDRIKNTYELRKYNVATLNTIRIVTIRHNDDVVIFAALFRCGVGYDSVVDNAHKGGVFGEIDVENGIVITDFVDIKGNVYNTHPHSGFKVKGLKIPMWNEVLEKAKYAALHTDNPITGWDIAITNNNEIEFIEGNSMPDFDMLQIPRKIGCKGRLVKIINDLFNNILIGLYNQTKVEDV